jgi:hypothetical protein
MDFKTPRWEVAKLIKSLGGVARVRTLCMAHGYEPPPYRTVQNWKLRDQAPADGLALLVCVARHVLPGQFTPEAFLSETSPQDAAA